LKPDSVEYLDTVELAKLVYVPHFPNQGRRRAELGSVF
jgi:hypothetical protein